MTRPRRSAPPAHVVAQYGAGFVFGVLLGLMAVDIGRQTPAPLAPSFTHSYPGP